MKILCVITTAIALICLGSITQANITIDTVKIGDARNVADKTTGYGRVNYEYNIGKYEVTAGQYTAFLNAVAKTDTYGLYNLNMSNGDQFKCQIAQTGTSGSYSYSVADAYANRPVNYVSYWDSLRFINWLGNGQGSGSTETGAYTLNGYNGTDGRTISRNAGATWALASEDEWYKAAYYKGGVYSQYANGTNIAPGMRTDSNYGSYNSIWDGTINGTLEQNGTKDMMGNVWEWNEALIGDTNRSVRGGAFYCGLSTLAASDRTGSGAPNLEDSTFGFRVVQVQAVPEPPAIVAACVMLLPFGLGKLRSLRKK